MIHPAEPPTELAGALSYFWPSELKSCLDRGSGAGAAEPADVSRLWHRPLAVTLVGLVLIPPGIAVVTAGFPDLFDDLGASVSPLGLMAIGVGISGAWFNGMRVRVALHLQRVGVSRKEVAREGSWGSMSPAEPEFRCLALFSAHRCASFTYCMSCAGLSVRHDTTIVRSFFSECSFLGQVD